MAGLDHRNPSLGIDLDNTIVCYDCLFHSAAVERNLVPNTLPKNKTFVRDHIRKIGRESEWTLLQGHVYGPGMEQAKPYAGVIEFLKFCQRANIDVRVISHRTAKPFAGPEHDLHAFASRWLDETGILRLVKSITLKTSLSEKVEAISLCNLSHFIDDLPDVLRHPKFPRNVEPILFRPGTSHLEIGLRSVASWKDMPALLGLDSDEL